MAVRPLDDSASLREGTDRLRALVYPTAQDSHDPEWHRSLWSWLESHPLAAEHMHRWVLATEAGEVVGHLAATPQWYRVNGQRVIAHTPADYQALPQYGFQAILLMRKFCRTGENCVSIDMVPSVIAVETRLGAEEAGEVQYMAKLLNISRLPAPPLPARVKKLLNLEERQVLTTQPAPAYTDRSGADPQSFHENVIPLPVRPRAPIPKPVQGLMNGGLRLADEALSSAFGGKLKVEVLDGFDESFDEMFEKVASEVPVVPEKNAEFLRWRYGPGSPQHPVTILGVRGGEGLLGYAVLGVTIEGFFDRLRDGYVLDLMTLPGRHDVARALLPEVVRYFRRSGVPLFRYRFLESPTSPQRSDLLKLGFFPRKGRRNRLLAKFADPIAHKAARDINNWSYSIGDGEATFWIRLS
ncbi:hypothetical protein BH24ACT19_BH24ACT19_00700 [soil metagenome]